MNTQFVLLQRIQAGDPNALQSLVEKYQPVVFRVAMSILDNPERAVAASREAFIIALNRLETLGAGVDFSTWLTHIVVNICRLRLSRQRRRKRWQRLRLGFFQIKTLSIPSAWKDLWAPARKDRPLDLWDAFFQMEELDRLALILRYDHRMTPVEIIVALGERERALQSRLFSARQRLLAFQAESSPDPSHAPTLESPASQPGQAARANFLSRHASYHRLIQKAADRLITDADAARLAGHLKSCSLCQEYQHRFNVLEDSLQDSVSALLGPA